ncbi:NUDIX domain-containing protein [Spirillospora sp. NPDC047279]|uniref:NUDIX hydrolase n=1 Tax=Spirillospora sp. NPDC047279 TaxID=3155478 RepID=UPI0033FEC32B
MSTARPPHATPRVAVDLVIMTVRESCLQLLLIERGKEPYLGRPALPGGFLRGREKLDDAAYRELHEETNLNGSRLHLEQLQAYSHPDRDPRGHVISVAYLAIAPCLPEPVAGSDARQARWTPLDEVTSAPGTLAFDHAQIVEDAVERARGKLEYTTLATAFCAEEFTIGELRQVYEVVWGMPVDERNFSRKIRRTEGFVVPTGAKRRPETGRPATLYSGGPATTLYPPMLRTGIGHELP